MSDVTVYYLEMLDRQALRAAKPSPDLAIQECRVRQYPVNRFLYQFIGAAWQWQEKLSWSDQQWREYAERDTLRTWLASCDGSPAGYYELEQQGDEVEIKYFGLAPAFIGRGFGGHLLSHAIEAAWDWADTRRVWVHTCSLDHPSALDNYQSRGMSLYKTELESD